MRGTCLEVESSHSFTRESLPLERMYCGRSSARGSTPCCTFFVVMPSRKHSQPPPSSLSLLQLHNPSPPSLLSPLLISPTTTQPKPFHPPSTLELSEMMAEQTSKPSWAPEKVLMQRLDVPLHTWCRSG